MKRKIYLSLMGLSCAFMLQAQDAERAVAKVHYLFKHVNDSTEKDKFLRDEVVTYLGQGSSYYSSYSSNRAQEDMKKQLEAPDFDGKLVISKNTTAINQYLLINQQQQSMQEIQQIATDHLSIPDSYPQQDWEILEETKDIGGYSCQKAVCNFKGRKYTAWFTTELPFSAGPWKLTGLPGLILSAADETGSVSFEYAGFDTLADQEVWVQAPANTVKSNRKEATKLMEAFKANPNAYIQAKHSGGAGGITTTSAGNSTTVIVRGSSGAAQTPAIDMSKIKSMTVKNNDDYAPSKVTNNPIELKP